MTTVLVRSAALGLAIAGVALWSPGSTPAAADELTVYTAIEADDLTKFSIIFSCRFSGMWGTGSATSWITRTA